MALCMGQVFHKMFIRSHCWELCVNAWCLLFVLELTGKDPSWSHSAALPWGFTVGRFGSLVGAVDGEKEGRAWQE